MFLSHVHNMSCVTIYIMYQDSAGYTVCPESLVTYYIKWVKPSWTDSTVCLGSSDFT